MCIFIKCEGKNQKRFSLNFLILVTVLVEVTLKLILNLRSTESAFDSLKIVAGATETAQQSRALTDDLFVFQHPHSVLQPTLKFQFQKFLHPLLISVDTRHAHGAPTYVQPKHSYT